MWSRLPRTSTWTGMSRLFAGKSIHMLWLFPLYLCRTVCNNRQTADMVKNGYAMVIAPAYTSVGQRRFEKLLRHFAWLHCFLFVFRKMVSCKFVLISYSHSVCHMKPHHLKKHRLTNVNKNWNEARRTGEKLHSTLTEKNSFAASAKSSKPLSSQKHLYMSVYGYVAIRIVKLNYDPTVFYSVSHFSLFTAVLTDVNVLQRTIPAQRGLPRRLRIH